MPNNFLVVGLCARDWSEDDEQSFKPLVGANLCELSAPLPDELRGITSPNHERFVNKVTGEVCKHDDHLNLDRKEWARVALSRDEVSALRSKYGAANWYDWQNENWGTKWGTYDTKVYELGGDGSPVLIEFQTAWGPPSPEMMGRINAYLRETYRLKNIRWIGHDPFDDSTLDIEVAPAHAAA